MILPDEAAGSARAGGTPLPRAEPAFDPDAPMVGMGEAADVLGVQPAFLRSLDTAGVLSPHRSAGGHRRYSQNQLLAAGRLRQLLDDGVPVAAAGRILDLEQALASATQRIDELESERPTSSRPPG